MKPLSKKLRGTHTWNAWRSLKERCNNPNNLSYKNYGARGITYDSRWEDFAEFVADMGQCPEKIDAWSLDRINNEGNYCKENCRWTTRNEQTHNSRKRADNVTGIKGVYREHSVCVTWIANFFSKGVRTILYKGPDFFEACCARKSWEAKKARGEA